MVPMTDGLSEHGAIATCGWAGRALEGDSGDLHLVVPFPGGLLVALLDGLGHGSEAAAASRAAVPVLTQYAAEAPLLLMRRCHEALRKTRGAVMTLASFRTLGSSMTWVGVGNVDGVLLRSPGSSSDADEALAVRGGVVGYQLPPLHTETLRVSSGDTLVLATDGIRGGFSTSVAVDSPPQEIAESILARFARGNDDAHVVVARYLGGGLEGRG
jgi:negative regulator of sigma-B (phosphoserine phosphatase)